MDSNNNPWLGLASYKTSDSSRFFGREREMEEIGASIKDNYCTVLYGVSGAGKTSIINAGLSPKLSAEGYLPISIRLDHVERAYSRQIIDACFLSFKQAGVDYECPFSTNELKELDERDTLWVFFHAATFWSHDNHKVVPVLFIDQFEEIFTLTKSEEQILSFFQQVESLFGSVPSERLISHIDNSNISLEFSETPSFRMVLSMREDFLARLEDYCYDIPILRKNRIGLRKMNGRQALDVIMKPQPGLIAEDVALRIISAVTGSHCSGNKTKLQMISVDTSILSLFCSELYNLSAHKGLNEISYKIVEAEGGDILKRFYEKNVSILSRRGRKYLEQHLLTSSGFRNQLAVEDINHTLIKAEDIARLETARIIRKEIINGTERIEFTHDILCKAAMESMKKAKAREVSISRILSYGAFAIVCLYFANRILVFIEGNIISSRLLFANRPHPFLTDYIGYEIKWLLALLWGLIYIPLAVPATRRKNIFIDIFLIIFSVLLFLKGPRLYVEINSALKLQWSGWVVILTTVPLINIFSNIPRITLREYLKSIFRFQSIKNDKYTKIILYFAGIDFLIDIIRHFRYNYILWPNSAAAIATTYLAGSFVIIALLWVLFSIIIPYKQSCANIKHPKIAFCLSVVLLWGYLLSQYTHHRWISYVLFFCVLGLTIYTHRNSLKEFISQRKYNKVLLYSTMLSIFYIAPHFISGINILALNDNTRVNDGKDREIIKIVSPEGKYGVMEGSEIIIPPSFKSIRVDWSKKWAYTPYSQIGFGRIATILNRLQNKYLSYSIVKDDGTKTTWNVMEHPEIDNKYTRHISKYAQIYPDDKYIQELNVNYYYNKTIVENKERFQKDFDDACEALFLRGLHIGSLPSSYEDFRAALDSGNKVDLSAITLRMQILLSTKAIKSTKLLDFIQEYINESASQNNRIQGLLCVARGEYDSAIDHATEANDDNTLLTALILQDDEKNYDMANILAQRITSNGQYMGEEVLNIIENLCNENKPTLFASVLERYNGLPQDYYKSTAAGSVIRRTLHNGNVIFINGGNVYSRYNKIVYDEFTVAGNYDYNHLGLGVYFENEKRGYISCDGNEVTAAKFDHAWLFSETNKIAVVEVGGKIGFINSEGEYTVQPSIPMNPDLRYYRDWIFEYDGHLVFPDEKERLFGLLNKKGEWIVEPQYEEIGDLTYGFRTFGDSYNEHRLGLMDSDGKIVLEQRYTRIDIDADYIEVRDADFNISYFKHDNEKILSHVLEKKETKGKIQDYINSNSPSKK